MSASSHDVICYSGQIYSRDAEHISSWHPGVTALVADWLDDEADRIPPNATHAMTSGGAEIPIDAAPAVRLARAYLGEAS